MLPARSHRRTALVAGVVFCGLATARDANAEERAVARLHYERAPETSACPAEDELRSAVAARLGYDPFVANAPRRIVARIRREGTLLRATVAAEEADGTRRERAPIVSRAADCRELGAALSLAMSIAVDPLSLVRAPEPPSSTSPPAPTAPEPPSSAPPPAPAGPARREEPPRAREERPALEGRAGAGPAASANLCR